MIDKQDNHISNCFLCDIMEQCSRQCIRRTLYAVMIGVSPIVICLLFIGLARLILHRLEMTYYRRQKLTPRRSSLVSFQSGRLALSYTPVSNAELQRIIQGDYQSQQASDSSSSFVYNQNNHSRKGPKFIKSILPRREPALRTSSILANLVIRRDAVDANSTADMLTPMETPLQPIFSIINEKDRRRPSLITITRESVETTTLAAMNNNNNNSHENGSNLDNISESEQTSNDPLMATTKTMTTTTTVVVEEFLEYHSVSSLPCALTLLNTVSDNENDTNSDINNDNEEQY
jgi:hypothetical protein